MKSQSSTASESVQSSAWMWFRDFENSKTEAQYALAVRFKTNRTKGSQPRVHRIGNGSKSSSRAKAGRGSKDAAKRSVNSCLASAGRRAEAAARDNDRARINH